MAIKSNRKLLNEVNKKILIVTLIAFQIVFMFINDGEERTSTHRIKVFIGISVVLFLILLIEELNSIYLIWRLNKINESIEQGEIESILNFNKEGIYKYLSRNKDFYKHMDLIIENCRKSKIEQDKTEEFTYRLIYNTANNLKKPVEKLYIKANGLKGDKDFDKSILSDLEQNAYAIKNIVNILFESSKITTTGGSREKINIDLNYILKQALAEFKDELIENKLDLNINMEEEEAMVYGNPEELWRAFQILMENIIKHSLKGSRVYIDVFNENGEYKIIMKNISKEKLNIAIEDLYKKINNKEWSTGLQLETVKAIISSIGEEFNVYIDGDLFKTEIVYEF